MQRIAVFCGSNCGNDSIYIDAAEELGRILAINRIGLVYGGGHIGLMGKMADAALKEGGEVIGVIPEFMVDKELAHNGATKMIVTDSMHERKATIMDLADAFIALPGGIGTLEELIEAYTWLKLRLIDYPIGILNTNGYYNHLIALLDNMVDNKFLKVDHRFRLLVDEHPQALIDKVTTTKYSFEDNWYITE